MFCKIYYIAFSNENVDTTLMTVYHIKYEARASGTAKYSAKSSLKSDIRHNFYPNLPEVEVENTVSI